MPYNIALVVLDTSHLARLATDWTSRDPEHRHSARHFVPHLLDRGWLPLLSWHQIAELLQHRDESLVDKRLRYLQSWPMSAWVTGDKSHVIPGSAFDVFKAEVRAAYAHPNLDLLGVRDAARSELLSFGTGTEALLELRSDWRLLRPALGEYQEDARKIAAISPWRATDIDNARLADLVNRPLRDAQSIDATVVRIRRSLEKEIAERGDRRIENPREMATAFMSDLLANVQHGNSEDSALVSLIGMLLWAGLEPADIDLNATFREAMSLGMFRRRLKMASDADNLPWQQVKAVVTPDRVPSAVIQEAMRLHAHDQPERKGSDVNDLSLLCLAPYATETFVDKRTLESVRRAKQKVPRLGELLGSVRKAADYHVITTVCSPR
ncbi:hypothetical protein [Caballeronia sp. ATUFL_M2_KS44]|uniref:hypothetical protein n=1 Tax=Caballeronia sp. ATUFL_M2_KS44 TaxID=2921767 RepID=UPI0020286541|nr:hypothetical protein [Caballeronia sp. ATUFL_M2_KS44]